MNAISLYILFHKLVLFLNITSWRLSVSGHVNGYVTFVLWLHSISVTIYLTVVLQMTRGYFSILLLQKVLCIRADSSVGLVTKCGVVMCKGIPFYICRDFAKLSLHLTGPVYIPTSVHEIAHVSYLPETMWKNATKLLTMVLQEKSGIRKRSDERFSFILYRDMHCFQIMMHLFY